MAPRQSTRSYKDLLKIAKLYHNSEKFGMSCWNAAQRIAQLFDSKKPVEILEILNRYPLEQRRFLVSIKYKHSSLLFLAVKNQNVSLAAYFLESCGADPNSFGWMYGKKLTSLCVAVTLNFKDLANILLKHGANTEILCSSEGRTALHYACENGRLKMVRLLIEHGANVNSRDYSGHTCLMESIHNLILCRYLISAGANVNLVNDCGYTTLALAYKTGLNAIIPFFIDLECADVRLKTDFEEDALHLAVQFSTEETVKKIIKKGSYSRQEVIEAYEVQSCLFHINNFEEKSKELWEKALRLRYEPIDAAMFQNPHPTGNLQEVVHFFFAEDIPTLLYLESVYGSSNMFTLQAFTSAVCKIGDVDKFVVLCNYFFRIVYSLSDKYFFMALYQAEQLMWHSLAINIVLDELNALKAFEMIVNCVLEIRARFERMTPRERLSQAYKVKLILYLVIDMIHELEWFCENVDSFHKGIAQILATDLRCLNQKSLLQMTVGVCESSSIFRIFLKCGVNVNSTDDKGKTVLHDLVELKKESSELVKLIINNDFDFHLVKYEEYCLACRMERLTALPNPVKHISLQCLAARAFCEKAMNCFSDVPHHLMTVINSHLQIQ